MTSAAPHDIIKPAKNERQVTKLPKAKKLNLVVRYGETGYFVNDLGEAKSPRFELYHVPTSKIIMKSNSPYDFDEYILSLKKEGKLNV